MKPNKDNEKVSSMFNRIAGRYDFLNHFLSLGTDILWRKKLAKLIEPTEPHRLLDVATGTADLALTIAPKHRQFESIIGVDMAEQMLEVGLNKVRQSSFDNILLQKADATELPFEDGQFSHVTIAFGIRNVVDVEKALSEFYRVLAKNGQVLILEFSLPENKLLKSLYLFYFRNILPYLAGAVSGDMSAYRYLNQTVETFPYGDSFLALLETAGFQNCIAYPLTMGISTIYVARK